MFFFHNFLSPKSPGGVWRFWRLLAYLSVRTPGQEHISEELKNQLQSLQIPFVSFILWKGSSNMFWYCFFKTLKGPVSEWIFDCWSIRGGEMVGTEESSAALMKWKTYRWPVWCCTKQVDFSIESRMRCICVRNLCTSVFWTEIWVHVAGMRHCCCMGIYYCIAERIEQW